MLSAKALRLCLLGASSSCEISQKPAYGRMTKPKQSGAYSGHRFPPEIIGYAVWAYYRFSLSLRNVEDLLAARGVVVSYETIRAWAAKFGSQYAKVIRRDRPSAADKWHLDEVVLPINGQKYWLWRAVDSKGDVLDILVQSQRNKQAATRFFSLTLQGVWPTASCCHGQTPKLWGRPEKPRTGTRAPQPQGPQQSIRRVTSPHSTARKDYGEVQVAETSPAFSFRS